MYRNRSNRYHSRRGASGSYLMPFLIIISVGVILVLVFNLAKSFFSTPITAKAYLHIVEGSVSMKTWGTEQFFNLSSDALVVEGDELKTSADAKVVIEFFDGSIMRIDGGGDVIFQVMDDDDEGEVDLLLVDGELWFNKHYKNTSTQFIIDTGDVRVAAAGASIFTVESRFETVVRSLVGEAVKFEVLSEEGKSVFEGDVEIGQQSVFNDEALKRFRAFQSPNVVERLSSDFMQTDWYSWNIEQDKTPIEFVMMETGEWSFVQAEPEILDSAEEVSDEEGLEGEDKEKEEGKLEEVGSDEVKTVEEPQAAEEVSADLGALSAPKLISVSGGTQTNADGFYVISGNPGVIYGSVAGAAKVVVNGYTLQKFKPGDREWTYFANVDYGLMKEGENIYEIYAIGADGKHSETITVKVVYQPKVETQVEVVPAPAE